MATGKDDGKDGWEEVTTGLIFAVVFGVLWLRGGSWVWLFPAAFAGVLPMVEGLRKMAVARARRRTQLEAGKLSPEDMERVVLQLARDHRGILTPSLVVVESDLSIGEAESILDGLAARGYTSAEIRENGRIEYEFREFMGRLGPPEQNMPGEDQ
jgi:hypothetical protein